MNSSVIFSMTDIRSDIIIQIKQSSMQFVASYSTMKSPQRFQTNQLTDKFEIIFSSVHSDLSPSLQTVFEVSTGSLIREPLRVNQADSARVKCNFSKTFRKHSVELF